MRDDVMLCLSQRSSNSIRKGRFSAAYEPINQCPLYLNIAINLPAFPTTQRSFGSLFFSHSLYLVLSLSHSGRELASATARLSGRAAIGFANELMQVRISLMSRFVENSAIINLSASDHRSPLDNVAEMYCRALLHPSHFRLAGSLIAWYYNLAV
jgi:hypothetical protein